MEHLNTRIHTLREFLKSLAEYFKIAGDVMVRIDPTTYERFKHELIMLPKQLETVSKDVATARTLSSILKTTAEVERIASTSFSLAALITTPFYEERLMTSKSVGFQQTVREQIMRITGIMNTYRKRSPSEDKEVIAQVLGVMDFKTGKAEIVKDLQNTTATSQLLIEIIRRLLSEDPSLYTDLISTIERLKDGTLGTSPPIELKLPKYIEPQMTYLHGLYPITLYMSAEELCKIINTGYSYDKSLSHIDNILKSIPDSDSVILIERTAEREVDYNVLSLTSPEYITAHDLHTNQIAGINKRILRRFATLRDVLIDANVAKSAPVSVIRGEKCYIVTTMNINTCRLMGTQDDKLYVDTAIAQQILQPISMRPTAYSEVCSDYILGRGEILEHQLLIKWYEESREASLLQTGEYKAQLLKHLVDSVEIDPRRDANPKMFTELCNNSYERILITDTMKFLGERKLEGREKKTTVAFRMDGLMTAFRNVLESVIKERVRDDSFRERADMERHLKGLYEDIMKNTIERLDTPPSRFQQLGITLKEHYLKTRSTAT